MKTTETIGFYLAWLLLYAIIIVPFGIVTLWLSETIFPETTEAFARLEWWQGMCILFAVIILIGLREIHKKLEAVEKEQQRLSNL
jgi:TRAP-type mannitol/chloroaromatic compound transport system permease small subunit